MDRHAPVAGLALAGLVTLAAGQQKAAHEREMAARGPPPCQAPDCNEPAVAPHYNYCNNCRTHE